MTKIAYVTVYRLENRREVRSEWNMNQWMKGDDNFHREGGPAVEFDNGTTWWYLNSLVHRVNGPAIEFDNGKKHWYIEDKEYIKDDYDKLIQEVRDMPKVLRLVDPRRWVREFK